MGDVLTYPSVSSDTSRHRRTQRTQDSVMEQQREIALFWLYVQATLDV